VANDIGGLQAAGNLFFAAIERKVMVATAVLTSRVFEYILKHGPQYSGDFVANIRIGVGKLDPAFMTNNFNPGTDDLKSQGDSEAIAEAVGNAAPQLAAIKAATLGTPIFISSSASHDAPYAWKIEKGTIKFRAENYRYGNPAGVFRRGAKKAKAEFRLSNTALRIF
jgi:hypothetical protein